VPLWLASPWQSRSMLATAGVFHLDLEKSTHPQARRTAPAAPLVALMPLLANCECPREREGGISRVCLSLCAVMLKGGFQGHEGQRTLG